MKDKTFLEHYRVCTDPAGAVEEIGRSGAAIVYKAVDSRTDETVALQLIPLASANPAEREQFEERARSAQKLDHVNIARVFAVGTDHGFMALASEFVEGQTCDAWLVENGRMSPAAALHVGLQVVRALGAAAFFSLAHRALQPSNIMIVPGEAPDGGWPFVKLLNFGLASAESHSVDSAGRSLAPSISPQFASPEQLLDRPLDFRSEVYSLGTTLCFLLTGGAPLETGMTARLRVRHRPELRGVPRGLRKFLGGMLDENPEKRPQDPVALEAEFRKCLTKFERRDRIKQQLGIPTLAAIPRSTMTATPAGQVSRGVIAFAVLILVGATIAAITFPEKFHLARSADKIGVPVGVPQAAVNAVPAAVTQSSSPAASAIPEASSNQVAANQTQAVQQPPATAAPQIAAVDSRPETNPPAEGPDGNAEQNDNRKNESTDSTATNDRETTVSSKNHAADSEESANNSDQKSTASSKKSADDSDEAVASQTRKRTGTRSASSQRNYFEPNQPNDSYADRDTRPHHGSFHARVIGRTPDGRPILRLRSGRVVVVPRGPTWPDYYGPPRQRVIIARPEPESGERVAPWQPFYPPD